MLRYVVGVGVRNKTYEFTLTRSERMSSHDNSIKRVEQQ